MPLCIFHTNMNDDRVTDEFHKKLSKVIAEITGSKEMGITVELRTGKTMCRAASPESDWGFYDIHIVGAAQSPDVNRERATRVLSFTEAETGLPQTSCFVMMHENNPIHIGLGDEKLVKDLPNYRNYTPLELYTDLRS